PMPGSNIGRTSDSSSKPGQCLRCRSMNSVAIRMTSALVSASRIAHPPMTSLLSVNGPSVTVILTPARAHAKPFRARLEAARFDEGAVLVAALDERPHRLQQRCGRRLGAVRL